jgi:hypothetical protein
MKKDNNLGIVVAVFLVFITFGMAVFAFAANSVTIVGTVNDDYTLVDDEGEIYFIAESENGDQLAENAGVRVSVTGIVEEDDHGPVIHIQSYKIIRE